MRRIAILGPVVGLAVLAAGAGSAPAATPPAASTTVARCATSPTKLTFARTARAKAGRLSWHAPKRPKGAKLTYRVYENGRRVAQTRARSARVAVRVGHRYRFSVAVVRGGRVQAARCRAKRTISVRVLPPSRPKTLKISVTGKRGVLTWKKSKSGDGKLAGYRVSRDGRTVRQLKGTRSTVAVVPDTVQRFTVRAVDTRGRQSAPATVSTGTAQSAPQAPTGLRALAVSDTSATLAWDPAKAGSGRVVGYRVFRDGRTLGQVAGTQMSVPRLETAKAYSFTVAAVDNHGVVSLPSHALTVSTNPPVPSTGSLHAFLLASTGSSFDDFKAHYRQIGAIHATYFECNRSSGLVQGRDDARITQFAKLRQVEVYARFDCQDTAVLHRILTEPALRGAWLQTLTTLAVQYGYDGVNVDFEAGLPTDRAAYTSFVTELAGRLHAIVVDVVFVMAWGIHWTTSAPGPIADMAWIQSIVRYVNSLPDRSKYVMGSPMYGMDWPRTSGTGAPAAALEWNDVTRLSARVGVPPAYDATAHETHFAYTDSAGVRHQVWASNAGAVLERMRLFRSNGYGIGVWRLGREDQAMWADPLLAS
jgi:hypothetical protein